MSDIQRIGQEVRVRFDLEVDDGFPPISAEFLIGIVQSSNLIKLDNTPFFANGVAIGDIVVCDGTPPDMEFRHVQSASKNKSISVILIANSYAEELYQIARDLDCFSEFAEFSEYSMLAISVPYHTDYSLIRRILDDAEAAHLISYAELCI